MSNKISDEALWNNRRPLKTEINIVQSSSNTELITFQIVTGAGIL